MKRKKSVLRVFLCILCLIFLLAACTEEPSSTSAEKSVGKRDTAKNQVEIVVGGDLMCQRSSRKLHCETENLISVISLIM